MKTALFFMGVCLTASALSLAHIHREAIAGYDRSLCGVASDEFKAALRYHGIKVAYQVKGEWRFVRGGKECRLFTNDFKRTRRE